MDQTGENPELSALQTLRERQVISQEEYERLAAQIGTPVAAAPASLPPPAPVVATGRQAKRTRRTILAVIAAVIVAAVAVTAVLVVRSNDQERQREAAAAEQAAAEQAAAEKAAAEKAAAAEAARKESEAQAQACTDLNSFRTGWSEFVGAFNQDTDLSNQTLEAARRGALVKGNTVPPFRRVLKGLAHPGAAVERDGVLGVLSLIDDTFTFMAGSPNWADFNTYVTTLNLLSNDLNDAIENLRTDLEAACLGES